MDDILNLYAWELDEIYDLIEEQKDNLPGAEKRIRPLDESNRDMIRRAKERGM